MVRKNFTVGPDVAKLLDDNADDNHSEIVRKLLRAYYSTNGYDVEQAAIDVRRQELRDHVDRLEAEIEETVAELSELDDLADEPTESDIETWLDETWNATDPTKATPENPLIKRYCDQTGNDPEVVAEAARKRSIQNQVENLSSVSAD